MQTVAHQHATSWRPAATAPQRFGSPHAGEETVFHFGQVLAHLARTRALGAGSIVGAGTIRSAADVMKKTENVAPNQVLLLKVRRGTEHRFVALKVK